jgi:hypothetical protein
LEKQSHGGDRDPWFFREHGKIVSGGTSTAVSTMPDPTEAPVQSLRGQTAAVEAAQRYTRR